MFKKQEQSLVKQIKESEENINALKTNINELKQELVETKLIYERCLSDSNEKDRIIALKTVIRSTFAR